MWHNGSSIRFVNILIVDINDNPVTDRVVADWAITFLRDGQSCLDPLSFENLGSGNYKVSYTPSSSGQDELDIYDAAADLHFSDIEDIYNVASGAGSGVFVLDHNFGGTDKLRVLLDGPAAYRLLLFASSDWDANRRAQANALGSSALDPYGRWINPIRVVLGTYHVVATKSNSFSVVFPYVKVGS